MLPSSTIFHYKVLSLLLLEIWYKGQRVNSPDLRGLDLLAQKQMLAVHIAKRSKYKRLLSLHVDSISSSGRKFKTVKCSFYHTFIRACNCKCN